MTKIDFSKMEGHTPGPWCLREAYVKDTFVIEGQHDSNNSKFPACVIRAETEDDAPYLNAKDTDLLLIAAAPAMKDEILRQQAVIEKLVEALKETTHLLSCHHPRSGNKVHERAINMSDSAIKKAKELDE